MHGPGGNRDSELGAGSCEDMCRAACGHPHPLHPWLWSQLDGALASCLQLSTRVKLVSRDGHGLLPSFCGHPTWPSHRSAGRWEVVLPPVGLPGPHLLSVLVRTALDAAPLSLITTEADSVPGIGPRVPAAGEEEGWGWRLASDNSPAGTGFLQDLGPQGPATPGLRHPGHLATAPSGVSAGPGGMSAGSAAGSHPWGGAARTRGH